MTSRGPGATRAEIDAVWRIESARVIAAVAPMVGDVGLAEDVVDARLDDATGDELLASAPADTDWIRIAALYEALARIARSPVVELNRAVALGMAFGPEIGLRFVDGLVAADLAGAPRTGR